VTKAKRLFAKMVGKKDAAAPPAATAGEDRVSKPFTIYGTGHTLDVVGQAGRFSLFLSSQREPLDVKLARLANDWKQSTIPELVKKASQLIARLDPVKKEEAALAQAYLAESDPAKRHALAVTGVNQIAKALVEIAVDYPIAIDEHEYPRAQPYHASGCDGYKRATHVSGDPISAASVQPRGQEPLSCAGSGLRSGYQVGHLLPDTLGGPVALENLVSVSRTTNKNKSGFRGFESPIEVALRGGTKQLPDPRTVLRYEVWVEYEQSGPERLEAWARGNYPKVPNAPDETLFAGIGKLVFEAIPDKGWSDERVIRKLRRDRTTMKDSEWKFLQLMKEKTAQLFLAKAFTITITVRAGVDVAGKKPVLPSGQFPNHQGAPTFPPD
jgi:hypothetical protein